MANTSDDTDPNLSLTQEDILAYLIGAVQRIESQLASEEPPKWAVKLFDAMMNIVSRIEILEKKVSHQDTVCKLHHNNGF